MGRFYAVPGNTVAAALTNTCVWFAVTFRVYLETPSVIAASVMAGIYTVSVAASGFFPGALVARYPKRGVMLGSSACSLALHALALALYVATPAAAFAAASGVTLWAFVVPALHFTVAGAIGLIVTLVAMRTSAHRLRAREYRQPRAPIALTLHSAPAD